jgi:hypothetical protein
VCSIDAGSSIGPDGHSTVTFATTDTWLEQFVHIKITDVVNKGGLQSKVPVDHVIQPKRSSVSVCDIVVYTNLQRGGGIKKKVRWGVGWRGVGRSEKNGGDVVG